MGRLFARKAGKQKQRDELLSAYLDDQLSAEEETRLEAQLATDPALQAELETLRHTVALVRDLPTVPVPRNFILPHTAAARPRLRPLARPRRTWAAPLLTTATAVASLLFVVVLAGDLLLSGAGGLAYAPAAERQAEFALEPPSNGQEVEAEEVVSDATEAPPPAAEAPVEAPLGATGESPIATSLSVTMEPPPKLAPEATVRGESYEMVTPVAEATVSVVGVDRDEEEFAPTSPAVEELAAAPTTAAAAPAAEADFTEPAPGEIEEEGEWDASGDERAADLVPAWVTPWRILEIVLGLAVLGLTPVTVWAWRVRRR